MTLRMNSMLVLTVCAALGAACSKKKATEAEGSGSGSPGSGTAVVPVTVVDAAAPAPVPDAAAAAPAPAAVTPELKAFDDAVAPILAIADEDERTKAACKALDDITTKIRALQKSPPAGVDAGAWNETVESMQGSLSDFEIECGEGSASNTKGLAQAAATSKDLHALLAKKPN